jgi:anti-sigma factor RsiW
MHEKNCGDVMNIHADIQSQLSAYCSHDLSEADRTTVERHLVDCPSCRARLADLRTTLHLMRSTPEVEAPPWMTSRIMAHLREEKSSRQSWLQRIWFPKHTAFPVKFLALLVVCISGYYLSHTVETELKQNAQQKLQEMPVQQGAEPAKSPVHIPGKTERQQDQPVATPPQTRLPSPAVPQPPARQEGNLPQTAPNSQAPSLPAPYAPAPPAITDRFSDKTESLKVAPSPESFTRSEAAAPEKKAKSIRSFDLRKDAAPPAASGRAISSPAGLALPQVSVRLKVDNPATAPDLIRDALFLSGGSIVAESGQLLTARIPAKRQIELLQRLEHLGHITERPVPSSSEANMVEVMIQW